MAAMFLTRSALFRFSKSLPYAPSLSLKPSMVTFSSTPNSGVSSSQSQLYVSSNGFYSDSYVYVGDFTFTNDTSK